MRSTSTDQVLLATKTEVPLRVMTDARGSGRGVSVTTVTRGLHSAKRTSARLQNLL